MTNPVSEWISKALNDLSCAKALAETQGEYFDQVCFLAQQCIEKLLKAYLIKHKHEVTKTHDLVKLTSDCNKINSCFEKWKDIALTLTIYSVDFRYPGENATKEEANESIVIADEFSKFIINEINKEI